MLATHPLCLLGICAVWTFTTPVVASRRLALHKSILNVSSFSTIPPCPVHSLEHTDASAGPATCKCEEGWQAVETGTFRHLFKLELEFAGTPDQKWSGECQRCNCAAAKTNGYSYLLFEGGGVRGLAYAGVVRALEDQNLLHSVEGFSGTSAGSQVAVFLAAGYTGQELTEVFLEMDFRSLADEDSGFSLSIISNKFGYYKGEALEAMLNRLLEKKTGLAATTFAQLHAHSCKGSCKKLRLPALNVNTGRLTWFGADTTPHISVAKAARASSSIPIFYQPTQIEMPDGYTYYFADGGALRNLPHDAFDISPEKPALGLSLRDGGLNGVHETVKFDGFVSYLKQLYTGILFGPNSANALDTVASALDIRSIEADDIEVTDFDLTPAMKGNLVMRGYNAVFHQLTLCKNLGMSLPRPLVAVPTWLARLQGGLLQKELAAKVDAEGVDDADTSSWWNKKDTQDLVKLYTVYKGHVQMAEHTGSDFKTRRTEVLQINDNMYIVTYKPSSPSLKEIFIVDRSPAKQHDTRLCVALEVRHIEGLKFNDWQEIWRGGKTSTMSFCDAGLNSGDNFLQEVCSAHGCVAASKADDVRTPVWKCC